MNAPLETARPGNLQPSRRKPMPARRAPQEARARTERGSARASRRVRLCRQTRRRWVAEGARAEPEDGTRTAHGPQDGSPRLEGFSAPYSYDRLDPRLGRSEREGERNPSRLESARVERGAARKPLYAALSTLRACSAALARQRSYARKQTVVAVRRRGGRVGGEHTRRLRAWSGPA